MESQSSFIARFAAHWGLEVDKLGEHIRVQLTRLLGRDQVDMASPAERHQLERLAIDFRNTVLGPIVKELYEALRARLWRRRGNAYVDDALSQVVPDLVARYWQPSWSTPAGRAHLHRYALKAVRRALNRSSQRQEQFHAKLMLLRYRRGTQSDPETQAIQRAAEEDREAVRSLLSDLDYLIQVVGLSPAEARAIIRSLRGSTAGLNDREKAAHHKAAVRARNRLRRLRHRLVPENRRQHHRTPVRCGCMIDLLAERRAFQVVDYSAGGIGVETSQDDVPFDIGMDCTVRIHSGCIVIVRGARCVRIDREDGKVRIGLEFHFPHPMPSLHSHREAALSP